jgi:hypothetical protein
MKVNKQFRDAILKAVDEQITSKEAKYARATYDRLIAMGITEREAKRMMGAALSVEFYYIAKGGSFDEIRYVGHLMRLPDESYLDEE